MNSRYEFYAFMGCLLSIVVLVITAAVLAYNGKSVEAIGVGAAVTGLIGVMKLPAQAMASGRANDPLHVEEER